MEQKLAKSAEDKNQHPASSIKEETLAKLAKSAKGGRGASSFARWGYGVTGRARMRNFVFFVRFVAIFLFPVYIKI